MAERRSYNKLQPPMSSTLAGGGSVATVEVYGGEFVDLGDLADDGPGIPLTRLFESPSAGTPSGQHGEDPHRRVDRAGASNGPGSPARSSREREAVGQAVEADCATLADVVRRLGACCADVEGLRRKVDQLAQKQEDADLMHRGQLDCISERIFEAEKHLRQAEERQDDAIEKASATFQKQSSNLMHVINQVNRNFEHLSEQIQQQGVTLGAFEQTLTQVQAAVSQASIDARTSAMAVESLSHEVSGLEHATQQHQQGAELEIQQQQQRLGDLCVNVQALRDAVLLMTPQAQFAEADSRQQVFHDQLEALRSVVVELQAEQQAFYGQLSQIQSQVRMVGSPGPLNQPAGIPMLRNEEAYRAGGGPPVARRPIVGVVDGRDGEGVRPYGLNACAGSLAGATAPLLAEPGGCPETPPTASSRLQQHGVRSAGGRGWGSGIEVLCEPDSADEVQQSRQPLKGLTRQLAPPAPPAPALLAPDGGRRLLASVARQLPLPQQAAADAGGCEELFQDVPSMVWEDVLHHPHVPGLHRVQGSAGHGSVPDPTAVPAPLMTVASGGYTSF